MGLSRKLQWVAIPFSVDLPDTGIGRRILYHWAPREAGESLQLILYLCCGFFSCLKPVVFFLYSLVPLQLAATETSSRASTVVKLRSQNGFSSVKKSIIPVSLFSGTPHLVCSDLLSGTAPQVRLLLFIPCPRPAVSLFAKEPWSLILENSFRNQGLSARCAQFDRSSSIHPFLKHMPFPVPSLDKTPEQKRRMKCK